MLKIERNVKETFNMLTSDQNTYVSASAVENAISSLPTGMYAGPDEIFHEHIVAGKQSLSPLFAHLFTFMLRSSHILDKLKRGIIMPLHKGGKNRYNIIFVCAKTVRNYNFRKML